MRKTSKIFPAILLTLLFCLTSCASLEEKRADEYALLKTAATYPAYKIKGEFGRNIPDSLDEAEFLRVVHDKIPENYYEELTRHFLVVLPKKAYYLLKVYDKETYRLVLFDYSCTTEPDGLVWEFPERYDLKRLEANDPCKSSPIR